MEKFFKELYVRIISETPEFFKKVRNFLIVVAAVMTTLAETGIELNVYGFSVSQILAFSSFLSALITQLAVKDGKKVQEQIDEIKNKQN